MESGITRADEVAVPVRVVELAHLKTKSGGNARVLCEAMDELELAKIYGMPGLMPGVTRESDPAKLTEFASQIAPHIIHAATALAGPDGSEVRPAFYFDDAHKVPGSIPGRYLRIEDKLKLVNTILENSGLGGAANEVAFHASDGTGSEGGVGTVAAGEGTTEVAGSADGTSPSQS